MELMIPSFRRQVKGKVHGLLNCWTGFLLWGPARLLKCRSEWPAQFSEFSDPLLSGSILSETYLWTPSRPWFCKGQTEKYLFANISSVCCPFLGRLPYKTTNKYYQRVKETELKLQNIKYLLYNRYFCNNLNKITKKSLKKITFLQNGDLDLWSWSSYVT